MPKLGDERGSKTQSRRPTTGASTAIAPFGVEGGGVTRTAAVAAGEMETVMDADKADKMRAGVAWERAVGHGLVDVRVVRPTREGDGIATTVFRDEEYKVFK